MRSGVLRDVRHIRAQEDAGEDESDTEVESEDEEALQKVRATEALAEVYGEHMTKDLNDGEAPSNVNAISEEAEQNIKDPLITRDIGVTYAEPGLPIDDGYGPC